MSVPHSVLHSTNYVNPDEGTGPSDSANKSVANGDKPKKKGGGVMAPFQKMRRRLTVTGASETIDGVSKLSVSGRRDSNDCQAKYHAAVRCAVTEYSGVSKKGHAPYNPRKKNQDALIMADDPSTNTLILCVLDGHGEHGDGVASHFRDQLAAEMISHPSWVVDVKKASADAIAKVEHQIIRNFRIDTEFSGTTLSMAIIRGNRITGVNIGDSRVIIAKEEHGKLVAEEFTHDHKPDSPKEKERILAAGGRVFAVEYDDGIDGPPRVWLGHMDVPGLAMSRSLGDAVAHTAGVISEPEFTERDLDPATDKFVVVATDGLWEFVGNEETVDLCMPSASPSEAVNTLVKEANTRWMREEQVIDDTTIIAAHLFDYKSS
uniref:PPM-type phosphatase domain-containing protein n=2 Tax=Trieres chinensis TaxID=1514140 RepID=A0A7S2A7W6_TRICV|mmetsp:Transcript_6158/g.12896  ORF Transcript_6158/g.12896 Transcript_6158/m.12896 type:complete len:376 (+) Transcript_6158:136-1263(+)|eukprot:CAMPEP_0183308708 /NCGR_PEP_ID=MMETSP0160_2-20130417/22412_1 /TAXON_ID=2839 ORGANISM="Odontella Sinensis, Strain Grunow 1884" /NCGR_SAMPLE_ID=MMETSP0160_2 /ASSEMBLY_ACC=CAM_ASM_000250 /LENGTH=375 /DNA_ID=CAMNT_0025472587 /DNA_START=85 /DNA_END=1212 /DNA_ORIENTATION=+